MEKWETFHRKTQVSSYESGATRIAATKAPQVAKAAFEGNCMSSSESACVSGSSSLITINSEPQYSDPSDSESSGEEAVG